MNTFLELIKFEITKILFERPIEYNQASFEVKMNQYSEHKHQEATFSNTILVTITTTDHPSFNLHVEGTGLFNFSEEVLDLPGVLNNYLKISAPALIYPYMRAFISNMILQSGMNPIILPTVNFASIPKIDDQTS